MQNKAIIEEQTEQIRLQVRELSDEQRKSYYKLAEQQFKDPDTYATLNYIFIAGLHHFYLGKWQLGVVNIVVFSAGIGCMIAGLIEIGVALLVGIFVFELYELFRSQLIVQNYNNLVSQSIIKQLTN